MDDDAACRDAIGAALQSYGVAARTAENGEEALRLARQDPRPCLIVLDLNMPIMDGWQFRAQQILDPTLAHIPVVVLSACDDVVRQAQILAAAAALTKPVDIETLLRVINEHGRTVVSALP